MIARYGDRFVVIERLSFPTGLAFPGGKQDQGETLSTTAVREYREETGLEFSPEGVLSTHAEHERDPRDWYVTTVFFGIACGTPRSETNKTRVLFLTKDELSLQQERLVLGHKRMWQEYLARA